MTDTDRAFLRFLGWLLAAALWLNALGCAVTYGRTPPHLTVAAGALTGTLWATRRRNRT